MNPVANHIWQSTLFATVAGLLTLALRKNHARVRHGVWLVASCKFLLPFSLLRRHCAPACPSGRLIVSITDDQPKGKIAGCPARPGMASTRG